MQAAGLLKSLASPRTTIVVFVSMAVAAVAVAHHPEYTTALVLMPFVLLWLNLGAAVLCNSRFRADLPLLVFHLVLLVFLGLIVLARLFYFDGGVKLTAGTVFEGNFLSADRGLLHSDAPYRLRFANDGLIEHTPPGSDYPLTYNRLRWWDRDGRPHVSEIGNDRPLVLDGYRISSTRLRGFAPLFSWRPVRGAETLGTAHLVDGMMAVAAGDFPAGSAVSLPGGTEAWVQVVPEGNTDPQALRRNLGVETLAHHLVVWVKDKRHVLRPGETLDLDGGQLRYVELGSWLGYRVTYDPTSSWMAATILLGVASLLWYYARLWIRPRRRHHASAVALR